MTPENSSSPWLSRYTKFVALSTLFLIYAGAMVTSTGSGLAVPDWPLSYGMLMPPMVGGIFYEHGHRMVAATVGFLVIIQAFWLHYGDRRPLLRKLGWLALAAVIVQGVLGGLTVLFFLPKPISIGHAALAEIFFCLNVSIAYLTSRHARSNAGRDTADASLAPRIIAGTVFLQVLAGAVMRHFGAGLAIPDFPLSFGRIIPPFSSLGVVVNFIHRAGAVVVLGAILYAGFRVYRGARRGRRVYAFMLLVVCAQILLGGWTVWSGKTPIITSFHVMTGALLLATSVVLALIEGRRGGVPVRADQRSLREVTA